MNRAAYLQEVWYGNRGGGWLRPLEWLFGSAAALRRTAYRARWISSTKVACPVVIVGNISVGGTGKTPLVVFLVEQLVRRGLRVAVIARGYGGKSRRVQLVTAHSDPAQVGDEATLIAARTNCHVFVCRDRVAAAQAASADGADVIVSDDGLQHYALARDVEIAVIDSTRGFGNGALLPRGPLREPIARLRSVHRIVSNGAPPRPAEAGEPRPLVMTLLPGDARIVSSQGSPRSLRSFRGERVHAVAGIGNPERFFRMLRSAGLEIVAHPFPDHHPFSSNELEFGDTQPVLMTEKDAVKCRGFGNSRLWYVPVTASFSQEDCEELLAPIVARLT